MPTSAQQVCASPDRSTNRATGPWLLLTTLLLFGVGTAGCASVSNPTADAVPVRRLPPEVLGKRKDEERTIPLTLLRQKPPEVYRLEAGDILGVWVEGILGEKGQSPPLQIPQDTSTPPALGFPIPVREDGTISLPLIDPIRVRGMSLTEVQDEVVRAYTVRKQLLQADKARAIVTLIRPRHYHVLVIRQDSGGLTIGASGNIGQTKRGTGYSVDLPAYENDVLNALSRTGGLPGLDAANEVIIQRGYFKDNADRGLLMQQLEQDPKCLFHPGATDDDSNLFVRIPLRLRPEDAPPFRGEDVILRDGDIVFIESRDTELFYTGGLLGARQFVLPRDYDLDVVQAIALANGPIVNSISQNNLTGQIVQTGLGFPSPSLVTVLRRTANGGQIPIRVNLNRALRDPRERILIQAGDTIILQQTVGEALAQYFTTVFRYNIFSTLVRQRDLTITGTGNLP